MTTVQGYTGSNSVGSSSSDSSRGTGRRARYRTVHLKRQADPRSPTGSTFGFSFRGGREFGTGFFVSVVEPGSDAHQKGVKVGDQIARINGLSVENATHHEILQLAQHHHHLTLSLKSVGLIPVKDNIEDPLTWRLVEQPFDPSLITGSCDVDRIVIDAPDGSKLGCGICKGPEWRPGIFVQYTKPNSLARQSGLQPGDQILQCNRVSFINIDFSYAVSVLKAQGPLDLVLRKGSGIDLFPGESSGYSSASSTTDEAISQTTMNKLPGYRTDMDKLKPLKSSSSVDCLLDDLKSAGELCSRRSKSPDLSKRPPPPMVTLRQECRFGGQTVVQINGGQMQVEVHQEGPPSLEKSPSVSSFSSTASLSSAISQELQRRKERRLKTGDVVPERSAKKPPVEAKRRDHDDLIAELKRRHDNRNGSCVPSNEPTIPDSSQPPVPPPPPPLSSLESIDLPPPCPTPDYSDTSARGSPQPSHTVKSSILRFEEKTRKICPTKSVTFGGSSTKEITPIKSDLHKSLPRTVELSENLPVPRPPEESSVEIVEMHSIDAQELNEPRVAAPKPPSTYFQPPPPPPVRRDTRDVKSAQTRTTVIKITEYPTENSRQPGKFDFLNGENKSEETFDGELARTLLRSNLKNRMETPALQNGCTKPIIERNGCANSKVNGSHYVPFQTVNQDELSNVKKTLRTFEKTNGTNTIIVQIPKRN